MTGLAADFFSGFAFNGYGFFTAKPPSRQDRQEQGILP
jgi:hypothetical protein